MFKETDLREKEKPMKELDLHELYYEMDTRKHQQLVAKYMLAVANDLIYRATHHDESKLVEPERSKYIEPVWHLRHTKYGTERHKELVKQMGVGVEHHLSTNDHHLEYYESYAQMNLIVLIEMCCDWIAASKRQNNNPTLPLAKYEFDPKLESIIRNTLSRIQECADEYIKEQL